MPGKGKRFKKGKSGNPNGRPKKGATITDCIKDILHQKIKTKDGKKELKLLFGKKIVEMALNGDIQAIKLIMNYTDGMPVQKIEDLTGKDITINLIDKSEKRI